MAAPSPLLRATTYERDWHRCVSCGSPRNLEFQHRQATGMGGSKRAVNHAGGLTSCSNCNPEYEGGLQTRALFYGWKVRRWVMDMGHRFPAPERVPVWYGPASGWFVLQAGGGRFWVPLPQAREMMVDVYGREYDDWQKELGL